MKQRTSEYRDQSGSVLLYLALNGAIGKRRNRGSIYSPQPTASSILFRDRYSRALAGDKLWRVARTIGSNDSATELEQGSLVRVTSSRRSWFRCKSGNRASHFHDARMDGWMDGWLEGRER